MHGSFASSYKRTKLAYPKYRQYATDLGAAGKKDEYEPIMIETLHLAVLEEGGKSNYKSNYSRRPESKQRSEDHI